MLGSWWVRIAFFLGSGGMAASCGLDARNPATLGAGASGSGGSTAEDAVPSAPLAAGPAGAGGLTVVGQPGAPLAPLSDAGEPLFGAEAGVNDAGSELSHTDAGTDSGRPTLVTLPACAGRSAPGVGMVMAATLSETDDFTLSCGEGVANDASFHWAAPGPGYYRFSTAGSSFDTTLALVSTACDGTELACDDDGSPPLAAEIVREFAASEEAVVVVDGKSGGSGSAQVAIERVTCPAIDLEGQPLPLVANTGDGTNALGGACGGAGEREKTYRLTAPADGLFRFSAASDEFPVALHLERGPACGGQALACNVGAGGFSAARTTRRLSAGDEVTIIVDSGGGEGEFQLDVQRVEGPCPSQGRISRDVDVVGVLEPGGPSVLSASCAPSALSAIPLGRFELPEHSYELGLGGGEGCRVSAVADGPIAMYVIDGLACEGPEQRCVRADDMTTLGQYEVSVDLGGVFADPSEHVIVVESTFPFVGAVTYTLSIICFTA